jgi:arylesterase/paraoxonase
VPTGLPQDNLSVDSDDGVWAAAVPLTSHRRREHFTNPEIVSASTALRLTLNSSRSAFFGEKYKVTKTLEDDGHVVSGATTVVYDAQREWLFTSSGYLDLWDSVQQLMKSRLGSTRSYVQAT